MTGAVLSGTNFTGADLNNANMTNAHLTAATIWSNTTCPMAPTATTTVIRALTIRRPLPSTVSPSDKPGSPRFDAVIEAAVILWIGLAVGIVGLATTAPNGVALIIRNIRRRIEERVAQLFPSRRTHTNAYAEAADTAAASDSAVAYVKRGVAEDASIEELVEVIGENLQALQDRVEQYEKDSLARHTALAQSVDALRTQLTDRIRN